MDEDIKKLKLRGRILEIAVPIMSVIIVAMFFNRRGEIPEVLRIKGLIIEDDEGRERILIGAPIPFASNRIRTDTSRIKATWGQRMGRNYMNWYQGYDHNTNGIMILDEDGWDKIALGDPVPDPIIGNRIGPSTGIILNDDFGLERSGYGLLNVDGALRVVLGLDHGNGTEGAALSVLPDGSVGLYLDSEEHSIFLGRAREAHWKSPDSTDFNGLILKDGEGNDKIISAGKGY